MIKILIAIIFCFVQSSAQAETAFAEVINGVVARVIIADQAFIASGAMGDPSRWIETSSTGAIRKNFAGSGFTYDAVRNAFIPPKPYPSWVLNEQTCRWDAPVAMPNDGNLYAWDEVNRRWVKSTN